MSDQSIQITSEITAKAPQSIPFAHLHVHTEYSLLESTCKIPELVRRAKNLGYCSLAITDSDNLFGAVYFFKECERNGIRPVIGAEVHVGEERCPLVLLAENDKGYQNLVVIVSSEYDIGNAELPRTNFETIRNHSEGLICLSGGPNGEVSRLLADDRFEAAREVAKKYDRIFGKEHYYLELQDHWQEEEKKINAGLRLVSDETGIPLVLTNDVRYINGTDATALEAVQVLAKDKKALVKTIPSVMNGLYKLDSPKEVIAAFSDPEDEIPDPVLLEAMRSTELIATRCNVRLIPESSYRPVIPTFTIPEGYTNESFLAKLCEDGLLLRYPENREAARERMEEELRAIKQLGIVDQILLFHDVVRFGKDNDLTIGPGRGSAPSSIVLYLLGATELDPLKHGLYFERYINAKRQSIPDISIDVCEDEREDVILHLTAEFGRDSAVAPVCFQRIRIEEAVRLASRVLHVPAGECESLIRMIPEEIEDGDYSINGLIRTVPVIKSAYEENAAIRALLNTAEKVENLPKTPLPHRGTVCISDPAQVPLYVDQESRRMIQYDFTSVEWMGICKVNLLALPALKRIRDVVRNHEQRSGGRIDLKTIDYEDPKVFKWITGGGWSDLPFISGNFTRAVIKEICPKNLDELALALLPERFTTVIRELKHCIVWQETIMKILNELGGIPLSEADLIRRAMSKKKTRDVAKWREYFIECAGQKGKLSRARAEEVFTQLYEKAGHTVNKSHFLARAKVAYQVAWLQTYYPDEYDQA